MPKMHSEGWTEARVERLKKMWSEGFSANDIAMTIRHVTRNAVIGKIHRLKLPKREVRTSTKPGSIIRRRIRQPLRTVFDVTPQSIDALEEVSMLHAGIPKVKQMRDAVDARLAAKKAPAPLPNPSETGPKPLNISLLDLLSHSCKWPCNSPEKGEEFLFCGHQRKDGSPYCELHHSRAYAGVSTRRPALPMRKAA